MRRAFTGRSLRTRILAQLSLLLVCTLVLVGLGVYFVIAQAEQRAWEGRQREAGRSAAGVVTAFLQRVDDTLNTIGAMPPAELDSSAATLPAIMERNSALLEVIRLDGRGGIIASSARGKPILANLFSITQSNWFRQAIAGRRYLGSVQIAANSEPYLIIAVPSADGGVVAGRLEMNVLWEVIAGIRFGEAGRAYVTNADGRIIAHPDPQVVLSYTTLAAGSAAAPVAASAGQRAYVNFGGQPVVGVVEPVPGTDWLLVAELPQQEVNEVSQRALLILSAGVLLFGLLLIGATTLLLGQLVFQAMGRLQYGAEQIGAGVLSYRIPVTRDDEIGQVTTAFNRMAEQLRDRNAEVAAQTAHLRAEIVERQRVEEELIDARDAAEAASRAKTTFLATMSHELRTPLTAIIGYSQLMGQLVEEGAYQAVRQDLQRIETAGVHLLSLINSILDLSQIESGKLAVHVTTVDVAALLDDVVTTVEPLLARSCNRLLLELAPDLGSIESDATKIRQVLINLLSNAAKFTEAGTITMRASRTPDEPADWLSLEVVDTGIGIAPQDLHRLFQSFSQVDDSSTRKYGGTGLGLALSQRLVEMLGGVIRVESEPGRGSTFRVYLPAAVPLAPPRSLTRRTAAAPPAPSGEPTPTVVSDTIMLVIDDDPATCDLVGRLLQQEQIAVVQAFGGEQGLSFARDLLPDAIVLDVHMPDPDGWAVLRALQADPATAAIPVLLMSVDPQQEQFAGGAAGFLAKPFEAEQLIALAQRYRRPPEAAQPSTPTGETSPAASGQRAT